MENGFKIQLEFGTAKAAERLEKDLDDAQKRAAEKQTKRERNVQKVRAELENRTRNLRIEGVDDAHQRDVMRINARYDEEHNHIKRLLKARREANEITSEEYKQQLREAEQLVERARGRATAEATTRRGRQAGLLGLAGGAIGIHVIQRMGRQLRRAAEAAFELGSAVQETESMFRTTFGQAAAEVDAFGDEFFNMAGLTQREGQEMTATFGQIAQGAEIAGDASRGPLEAIAEQSREAGNDLELAGESSAAFSQLVVQAAGDMASFNNADISGVLQNIQSGLTGQVEPLRKFGVELDQASAQQRALELTGKSAVDELENQDLILARLSLLYDRAGNQMGDLARTQDSAANRARRLAAEWREQGERLSRTLLPMYEMVIDAISEVTEGSAEALTAIVDFVARGGFGLVSALLRIAHGAYDLGRSFVDVARAFGVLDQSTAGSFIANQFSQTLDEIVWYYRTMARVIRGTTAALFDFIGAYAELRAQTADVMFGTQENVEAWEQEAESFRARAEALRKAQEESDESEENLRASMEQRYESMVEILEGAQEAIQESREEAEEFFASLSSGGEGTDELEAAVETLESLRDSLHQEQRGEQQPYAAELDALAELGETYPQLIDDISEVAQGYHQLADAQRAAEEAEYEAALEERLMGIRHELEDERQRAEELAMQERFAIKEDSLANERRLIEETYEHELEAAEQAYNQERELIEQSIEDERERAEAIRVIEERLQNDRQQAEVQRIEGVKQVEEQAAEEARQRFDELTQEIRRYTDSFVDELFGASDQQFSDAEIDMQRHRLEQQEEQLEQSLQDRQITQQEYNLQVQQLHERRAQFEKDVERDRAGFMQRSARATQQVVSDALREQVQEFIAQKAAEVLIHTTAEGEKTAVTLGGVATRTAALAGEVADSLLSAGASIVNAVAKAVEWLASRLGPAGLIALPALGATAYAGYQGVKGKFGFASGGYTGRGHRYEIAGAVHRGEVVMEKPIVEGQEEDWLTLRALAQKGVRLKDLMSVAGIPGYASGGLVGEVRSPRLPSTRGPSSTPQESREMISEIGRIAGSVEQLAGEVARMKQEPPSPIIGDSEARKMQRAARREEQRRNVARRDS